MVATKKSPAAKKSRTAKTKTFAFADRASGILLHPTSLPGRFGAGDIGPAAHDFIDFLAAAGQHWWQMLPIGPVGYGNSPYSSHSAFAGNPLLISPELLVAAGWLGASDLADAPHFPTNAIDFGPMIAYRQSLLTKAAAQFAKRATAADKRKLARFVAAEKHWLPDFSLFYALKTHHQLVEWTRWPADLRARKPAALASARKALAAEIAAAEFLQWQFAEQWAALKAHARSHNVGLIGDVPIFIAHDSADVWAHQAWFHLRADGQPSVVSGVPPDYFSATGQRWGNPLYRWNVMQKDRFRFWRERIASTLGRFDSIRLDHFIGFYRYWEIPGDEPTAQNGKWRFTPGNALFATLQRAFGTLPLIAEDLGLVTPEVIALRDKFKLPGIKILQFAFGDDPSAPSFLPHNYVQNSVAYTGTHDNETIVGWFRGEELGADQSQKDRQVERERACAYMRVTDGGKDINWDTIATVMASVARLSVFPLQDIFGLGKVGRMNLPGRESGNWAWRFTASDLTPALAARLRTLAQRYGRA